MALRALPACAAAMGTPAVPVVGVVGSWMQLGERPTAVEAASMGLIIAAPAVLAAYGVIAGRRAAVATGGQPAIPPVID